MQRPNHKSTTYASNDSYVEFVSPHSLEACVARLKDVEDGGILESTRVYTTIVDNDHADFEIRKWYALNFIAEVSGDLTQESMGETAVYASASLNARIYALTILG